MNANPAVFLDRDGVLNQVTIRNGLPVGPTQIRDFTLVEGASTDVRRLKNADYLVVVVTNQPELARGRLDSSALRAMHQKLLAEVPIDAIYVCPHDDQAHCLCRKPRPGLLLSAANDHKIDLSQSFMVGDRWRDIEAGRAVGCRTILIEMGYREELSSPPDWSVGSLHEAVDKILCVTSRSNTE